MAILLNCFTGAIRTAEEVWPALAMRARARAAACLCLRIGAGQRVGASVCGRAWARTKTAPV